MRNFKVIPLICLVLTWTVTSSQAAASAAAAIDSKASSKNSAAVVENKGEHRESHSLKSDVSYSSVPSYTPYPLAQSYGAAAKPATYQSPHPYPVPAYSNPQETTMGFVYYYLPTVEKYYPKIKDFLPFFKKYEPLVSRAWPVVRNIADRTFDIGASLGLIALTPIFLIAAVGFLGYMLFIFIAPIFSFGRRRIGRDINDHLNDPIIPLEESRSLSALAARIDIMLDKYMRAMNGDDTCMERISCQAGEITSRLGQVFTNPIVKFLEPYIPSYMYNKLTAFKAGARSSGTECSQYKCKLLSWFL